ncbi:5271_t:CDS:2 [Entrophospora sp. SA101]|nr:5271_t:CDS:2 [Entrophospora sp. SA101]
MNLQYAYTTNIQTGVKTPLSIYQGALFLIHQEILLGALGIFALLVGFVITFFLFYQFYLIYCGTTSNEAFKWEDLDEIISNDELWVYDGKTPKNKQNNMLPSSISLTTAMSIYWIQPNIKKRQVSTDSKNSKNVNGNNNNSNNNGNDVNIPDSIIPLNSKSGSSNQHGNEKVNNQDVNYNNNIFVDSGYVAVGSDIVAVVQQTEFGYGLCVTMCWGLMDVSLEEKDSRFSDRYVLITGCDSIVGNWLAKALHKRGYYVFVGCQTEAAFKEFIANISAPNFRPFLLDITKDTSLQQCARMVEHETKGKGLFALVNNASCNEGFAFEFTSNDQILRTMEMNFMGPIKIVKTLLPYLRQNIKYNLRKPQKEQDISPRIIMMTSILGRTTIPFYGAYSASKHALEAMLDTIRVELLPWKIHISMIESVPLTTSSRSSNSDLMDISKNFFSSPELTKQTLTLYGEDYIQKALEFWQKLPSTHNDANKDIVRTIVDAIEVGFPNDRYVVGTVAKLQIFMHNFLPRWVLDLAWGSFIRLFGVWPKEVRELEEGPSADHLSHTSMTN